MTEASEEIPISSVSDRSAFVDGVAQLFGLFLRGTGLMLSVTAMSMALLCLGGVFSDRLDALTHVLPLWTAMGAGGVGLGGLFSRGFERRAIVGFGAVAVLICAGLMAPELWAAARFQAKATIPTDLKIVQFNVWDQNTAPQRTVDWIIAENPDIVIIEEAGSERAPILAGLRAAFPFASCDRGKRCGTVIFSRFAMLARGGSLMDRTQASTAWATLAGPQGAFTVIGAHQSWPLPVGAQRMQSENLARMIARLDTKTTIVTGDFNSTPWSFAMRRQDKAFGLRRWTRALPSWPAGQFSRVLSAPAPLLPIDHVYAGADWRAVQVRRGPVLGSDHRPVVVQLRLARAR